MKMMKLSLQTCMLLLHLTFLINSGNASQIDRLNKLLKSCTSDPPHHAQWHIGLDVEEDDDVYVGSQVGSMETDKIDALPGQPEGVDFDQYAGYITVDANAGRALFYYFVESPRDSSSKPLVLWLNGGPGCSSLGYGAMEELGPFRVNSDGVSLYRNDYAWNDVANILFLESPAGVGFSYSNTSSDYVNVGDKKTAKDSYKFLINWLERFPHYKTRDFFITGESYAGHYVPQLAYTIVVQNKITDTPKINLKGIAIGNALLDDNTTSWGFIDYLWSHAMISDETYSEVHKYCDFNRGNALDECQYYLQGLYSAVVGKIDIYNIYAPLCPEVGPQTKSTSTPSIKDFDPCSDNYVHSYLNLAVVQAALHLKPTNWQSCSDIGWTDRPKTILPIIENLIIQSEISLWIYSGDIDARVPVTASRDSINTLNLPVQTRWRPWYSGKEVGGYVVGYKGLTFATVRGAGHEVPSYQPERALTLFSSFLQGTLPPPGP